MRNFVNSCLPMLALLALGGCAGTSALTSSEDDGVYYSSKDRTTAVVQPAPAPASASEEANPDYNGNTATAPRGSGSAPYYDNTYTYMRGVPGYGPGVGAYTPYSPYTTLSYAPYGGLCTGFGYGWGGGACGFSPYAYGGYDPFYSSFYSPYGYGYSPYYGYGSGVSISFGFGRPYYGGFGYGYSPFGYGYGYSPYYYGSNYYGGYYGRGGYYGSQYNGGYYGSNGGDSRGSGRTYGHRTDRAAEGSYRAAAPATGGSGAPTGGHVRSERMAGNTGQPLEVASDGLSRTRRDEAPAPSVYSNQPQRIDDAVRPRYRDMETPVATDFSNGRVRPEGQPQGQPATAPQEGRRRSGFFQNVFGEQPAGGGGQATEQPRQRTYSQPRQRTYDQPRPQTYEQPQRSYSQPSYSAPSYGGSGGGGSNSGGGGGGGRRGRD